MDGLARDTDLIRRLVEYANLSPAAVAKRAGVAATTVNRPFTGTAPSRLGRAALEKLQAAFPDFPGWAASSLADHRLPFKGFPSDTPARDLTTDVVEVDQIDLRYGLGATYVDGPVDVKKLPFSRSWLRLFTKADPEHLFWSEGEGSSMAPTINDGEIVLIDRARTIPRVGGGVWAFTMGEMGMIKRLHIPGKGRIQLLSDSGLEPPIEPTEDDELKVIGRVVAVVKRI